jgi:hypothetical protein
MNKQQMDPMRPVTEQPTNERRRGKGYQEQMLYIFGIMVILIGVGSWAILHIRTRPGRDTSESADDAAALEANIQQSTNNELQWLSRALGLVHRQETEIRPVVEAEVRARKTLIETPSGSTSDLNALLVGLRHGTLERIRPVLTLRQQVTLRKLEREGMPSSN